MTAPAVALKRIDKRFGAVHANRAVDLAVERGTVHGIVGENGAGKSTLVAIISGQRAPTSGSIILDGREVAAADVRAMEEAGVFLVTQEPMIIDHISNADIYSMLGPRFARAFDYLRSTNLDALPSGRV